MKAEQLDLVDRGPKRDRPTPMLVEEWSGGATSVHSGSCFVDYRKLPLGHMWRAGHFVIECPRCRQPGEAKAKKARDHRGHEVIQLAHDAKRVVHSVEVVSGKTKVRAQCRL
jgi:hypothetical protein